LEIKDEDMLKTVRSYVLDLGIDLNAGIVPLGYDYGCGIG
jgi:hypothetical protein